MVGQGQDVELQAMGTWQRDNLRRLLEPAVELERKADVRAACEAVARLGDEDDPELLKAVRAAVEEVSEEDLEAMAASPAMDPLWAKIVRIGRELAAEDEDQDEMEPRV